MQIGGKHTFWPPPGWSFGVRCHLGVGSHVDICDQELLQSGSISRQFKDLINTITINIHSNCSQSHLISGQEKQLRYYVFFSSLQRVSKSTGCYVEVLRSHPIRPCSTLCSHIKSKTSDMLPSFRTTKLIFTQPKVDQAFCAPQTLITEQQFVNSLFKSRHFALQYTYTTIQKFGVSNFFLKNLTGFNDENKNNYCIGRKKKSMMAYITIHSHASIQINHLN